MTRCRPDLTSCVRQVCLVVSPEALHLEKREGRRSGDQQKTGERLGTCHEAYRAVRHHIAEPERRVHHRRKVHGIE